MASPVDDPLYQAGYRQGLADSVVEEVSPKRRYVLATGALVGGLGTAAVGAMLFSPRYRSAGAVIAFSATVLGAVFAAAHILVDRNPETPTLRLHP